MSQLQTKFISNNAVTNGKLAQMAAHTYKGNNTGATSDPLDVTATQLTADLDLFTSSLQGLVPGSGGGTTNFLRADGTWAAPTGSGGTVTTVSVVSANGLAGTVANASTTPAITLSTTITGLLKGNGTAISAAVSGTDYQPAGNYITALTGDVTAAGPGSSAATIANSAVTNAKLANMAAHTYKGNNTGSSSAPLDVTATQLTADLNLFTSSLQGLVPGSGGGTSNFLRADGTWAAPSGTGVSSIGTINSQTPSANGLVISGTTLYGQYASTSNPGMVSLSSSGAIVISGSAISVQADNSTSKINGSNQVSSLQPVQENITLSATNITNQFVDLQHPVFGASPSNNSVTLTVVGGPQQLRGTDFTVSLTGGVAGVTRITFAGDLATGGNAALIAGDILIVGYLYLA